MTAAVAGLTPAGFFAGRIAAVPQIVVYNPSHRGVRKSFAHWLRRDGKTFCGRDPKRSVGWEPHDGSPSRICGRCMRSASGMTRKVRVGSTPR